MFRQRHLGNFTSSYVLTSDCHLYNTFVMFVDENVGVVIGEFDPENIDKAAGI